MARHRRIYQMNASWCQISVVDCDLPTYSHMSCHWPKLGRVAGHWLWSVHVFGTCCQRCYIWWMIVCALSIWLKAHLFDWGCGAKWLLFCFQSPCINSLTYYLLAYLLFYLFNYFLTQDSFGHNSTSNGNSCSLVHVKLACLRCNLITSEI